MKTLVLSTCVLVLLTACSPRQTPRESCASYGLKPGTDAYAQCVGAETRNDKNNRREAMRDWNAANARRGGSVGNYCPIGLTC
jgi:hypothetical protein